MILRYSLLSFLTGYFPFTKVYPRDTDVCVMKQGTDVCVMNQRTHICVMNQGTRNVHSKIREKCSSGNVLIMKHVFHVNNLSLQIMLILKYPAFCQETQIILFQLVPESSLIVQ